MNGETRRKTRLGLTSHNDAHLRRRVAYYDQYSTIWATRKGKKEHKGLRASGNKKEGDGRLPGRQGRPTRVVCTPVRIRSSQVPYRLTPRHQRAVCWAP